MWRGPVVAGIHGRAQHRPFRPLLLHRPVPSTAERLCGGRGGTVAERFGEILACACPGGLCLGRAVGTVQRRVARTILAKLPFPLVLASHLPRLPVAALSFTFLCPCLALPSCRLTSLALPVLLLSVSSLLPRLSLTALRVLGPPLVALERLQLALSISHALLLSAAQLGGERLHVAVARVGSRRGSPAQFRGCRRVLVVPGRNSARRRALEVRGDKGCAG
mmetsp:Transcript_74695/g.175341  ORF Transcript_74695/g.175341 Transcript_74695/m.175341 type:complete len:221 (+) Transcript_74695:667-1329(+)